TGLAPTGGGIRAPAMTFTVVIVMMSGLLLGERGGIYTGVTCMVIGFGLCLAEMLGVLPAPAIRHTAVSLWLSNSLLIVIGIVLQRLATRTVRSALDRAERELEERKQTEERLRAVTQRLQLALEAGEIGVWDWDLQTNQVVYDDRLFAIHGLRPTPDRVVLYQDWARRVHPDDLPQQESALRHLAADQDRRLRSDRVAHERRRRDFRIPRPNGTMRHIQSAAAVIADDKGQPIRLVGMNIDVTEQKQAERERERLVHDLGERVKELGRRARVA